MNITRPNDLQIESKKSNIQSNCSTGTAYLTSYNQSGFDLSFTFPDPFINKTALWVTVPYACNIIINVENSNKEIKFRLERYYDHMASYLETLDFSNLPNGTYYVYAYDKLRGWISRFGYEQTTKIGPFCLLDKVVLQALNEEKRNVKETGGWCDKTKEIIGKNKNWSPIISDYLNSVGVYIPASWCLAFIYYCFWQVAGDYFVKNLCIQSPWTPDIRDEDPNKCTKITSSDAYNNPSLIKPGYIFYKEWKEDGKTKHHVGLIKEVVGKRINTIEGNTKITGENLEGLYEHTHQINGSNIMCYVGYNNFGIDV